MCGELSTPWQDRLLARPMPTIPGSAAAAARMIAACHIFSDAMQKRRLVAEPDGWDTRPGPGACSGSFGMLASDNGGRCSGDLLDEREIESDPGEGFIEPELVDLSCIGNAIDSGDQFVASAEGEIVVQVFVAVYIDLGRELAIAGGADEKMDMRWPITMATHRLQQLLRLATGRTGVAVWHN